MCESMTHLWICWLGLGLGLVVGDMVWILITYFGYWDRESGSRLIQESLRLASIVVAKSIEDKFNRDWFQI